MYCQHPDSILLSCADPGLSAGSACEDGSVGGSAELGALLRPAHGLPHLPPPRPPLLVPFCASLPDPTHVQPGLHTRTAGVRTAEREGRVIRVLLFLGGEEFGSFVGQRMVTGSVIDDDVNILGRKVTELQRVGIDELGVFLMVSYYGIGWFRGRSV